MNRSRPAVAARLRTAFVCFVVGCAGLLGLLWTFSFYTELAASLVPGASERRFGDALWERTAAAMPEEQRLLARDLEALAYRLAVAWPDNPYELRVAIRPSEEVQLQALPGGSLLLTTAMLEAVQSEDELAFALAHEIGHLRQREHLLVLGRCLAVVWVMDGLGLSSQLQGEYLEAFGLLGRRVPADRREEAADRFALQALALEYGHVAGALNLLDHLSKLGAPPDHYVLTPRQAMQRRAGLIALARTEGWKLGGEPRPPLRLP